MTSGWTVQFATDEAESEVRALSDAMQARFFRLIAMIERHGLERMQMPYARHLRGKLWELRMKGPDGIARSIYVTASGRRVFVLRTFLKKTQRTPPEELVVAARRASALGLQV